MSCFCNCPELPLVAFGKFILNYRLHVPLRFEIFFPGSLTCLDALGPDCWSESGWLPFVLPGLPMLHHPTNCSFGFHCGRLYAFHICAYCALTDSPYVRMFIRVSLAFNSTAAVSYCQISKTWCVGRQREPVLCRYTEDDKDSLKQLWSLPKLKSLSSSMHTPVI